jgi:hypothetical protein
MEPEPEPEPDVDSDLGQLADEPGSILLVVRKSKLAGRGLFLSAPGKPAAIEYIMSPRGPISMEEQGEFWEHQLPGHDYIMSIAAVDDGGFRDEHGNLRTKMALFEYVGKCKQQIVWDDDEDGWDVIPPLDYVGELDPTLNPAAYANDRLYQQIDGQTQAAHFAKRDAELNPLVMVPSLGRVVKVDPDRPDVEFEFKSMWFYPRRGWQWPTADFDSGPVQPEAEREPQHIHPHLKTAAAQEAAAADAVESGDGNEVTVGYYWPIFKRQPDAYAQFCSIS